MSGSVHLQIVNNVYFNFYYLNNFSLKNPSLLIGLIPFLSSFGFTAVVGKKVFYLYFF